MPRNKDPLPEHYLAKIKPAQMPWTTIELHWPIDRDGKRISTVLPWLILSITERGVKTATRIHPDEAQELAGVLFSYSMENKDYNKGECKVCGRKFKNVLPHIKRMHPKEYAAGGF